MAIKQVFNSSAELNYPKVLPTLDLNFANTKTLDPRITFTRASGGSYVGADGLIKYAGVNEARFDHDPETGESLGLLIEEARTNLILHNTKHNEIQWITPGSSETINTTETLSPDGTNNATKLFGNNGITIRQSIYQLVSVTSGTTYTFSVFLKQGQRRYATIWFDSENISQGAFFGASTVIDLQTGTLATGSQTVVIPYPNGWYRCYVTATPTATQSMIMNVSVGAPNNTAPYDATGDGSSGIYIWGHQLEVGSFPTSYIPTQGSTRTRAVDNASITGKNFSSWYRQDEGSIFSSYIIRVPANANQNNVDFVIENATSTNRIIGWNNFAKQSVFSLVENNVANYVFRGTLSKINTPVKKIIGIKDFDVKIYVGTDALIGDFASGIPDKTPTNLTRMFIGVGNGFSALNGTISRLTYFPKRLPNSQLQTLTS